MLNLKIKQRINARRKKNNRTTIKNSFNNLKEFSLKETKFSLYLLLLLISGVILFFTLIYWDRQILKDMDFSIPSNDFVINNSLLQYASFNFTGIGSGFPYIDKNEIISTVESFEYQIEKGDTLSKISKQYEIDVGTLISYNNIIDVRQLSVGADLKIPDIDGLPYIVKNGDSLKSISENHEIPLNNILDANNLDSEIIKPGDKLFIPGARISEYDYKKATGTLFLYPTIGRLASPYGYRTDPFVDIRRIHYGIDIANKIGTDVRATMSGTVAVIAEQPMGYGKYILIRHERGFQSLYGHLNAILVKKGQRIKQGQKIGEMGTTGRSTGPHLHFALYKHNIPINPLNGYLHR